MNLPKKNDPNRRPPIIGSTFQLCQDSVEGDYWLELSMDGRRVIISQEYGAGLMSANFIEGDANDRIEGRWDELMGRTLRWLGRFEPKDS